MASVFYAQNACDNLITKTGCEVKPFTLSNEMFPEHNVRVMNLLLEF